MGASETENSNPVVHFLGNDTKIVVMLKGEKFVEGGYHTKGL